MHAHGSQFDGVLPLYVANGVTGIREMAGPPDANQFRRELAARHIVAHTSIWEVPSSMATLPCGRTTPSR